MEDPAFSNLAPVEWRELQVLMQQARYRRLAPGPELRLRELLGKRDARAPQMAWPDLVSFGMVVLGAYFMVKAFS